MGSIASAATNSLGPRPAATPTGTLVRTLVHEAVAPRVDYARSLAAVDGQDSEAPIGGRSRDPAHASINALEHFAPRLFGPGVIDTRIQRAGPRLGIDGQRGDIREIPRAIAVIAD